MDSQQKKMERGSEIIFLKFFPKNGFPTIWGEQISDFFFQRKKLNTDVIFKLEKKLVPFKKMVWRNNYYFFIKKFNHGKVESIIHKINLLWPNHSILF